MIDEKKLAEIVPAWIKAKTPLQEGEWAEKYGEDLIDFAEYAIKVIRAAQDYLYDTGAKLPLVKALAPFAAPEEK